ncbi:MAG TPA: hypothetical protein VK002_12140 [Rubricoccaceae bacterium]|nr:hypothetical protein [Rubricoccaceae bacterium]
MYHRQTVVEPYVRDASKTHPDGARASEPVILTPAPMSRLSLALVVALALAGCRSEQAPAAPSPSAAADAEPHPSFLYGRVTTVGGETYEGRLRFGGGEEAFWGDYFNGFEDENPWAAHVPPERLAERRRPVEIFGIEVGHEDDLGRPFMARFGDIAKLEARGGDLRVTLKSGTVVHLDRYAADDFADGLRVWDDRHGVVDLHERQVRSIEFLPPARTGAAPSRLHGTVRTRRGAFTGFLQWNREEGVGLDALDGRTADGEPLSLRFDAIRSIERRARDSSLVTLRDGRTVVLTGTREVGRGNGGVYVDDARYGRVLVSWDAFERADLSAADSSGPAYGDFPPGHPLTGRVATRDGRRLAGRLVYDLDESETTETLDAPSGGVDYTIPFGLVASIELPGGEGEAARVTLHSGEALPLARAGDLGEGNAGLLVFAEGGEGAEYVPWAEVERVDFDRPAATYPPVGGG